jgi:hypothetical protein
MLRSRYHVGDQIRSDVMMLVCFYHLLGEMVQISLGYTLEGGNGLFRDAGIA